MRHAAGIIRGQYHPRGPQDVPLDVARLLPVVSAGLAELASRRGGSGGMTTGPGVYR